MEDISNIWRSIKEVLEYELISIGNYHLSIYNIILFLLILFAIRLLVKGLKKLANRQFKDKNWIPAGKQQALIQIGTYFIYIFGLIFAINSIGFNVTALLIGSSALFIGLGFALQEAFRDFISGLILLFEGDMVVGDIIEFENGMVVVVKQIKLRTSKVRTRDGIVIFVPNSQLTNNRIINWSNSNLLTRFHVSVGVAYGSDTELVEKILMEVLTEDEAVSSRMKPFVSFTDFGESSLNFEAHFWTEEVWSIEFIKSNMRFAIDKKFRENNISIPFPQRDLHIKSSEVNFNQQKQE